MRRMRKEILGVVLSFALIFTAVSLLSYHEWGRGKYEQLGRKHSPPHIEPPSNEHLQALQEIIEGLGVNVSIGR